MQYEVGQEVAILRARGAPVAGVVERITPTGRTVVNVPAWKRSMQFDKSGYEVGGSSSWGRDRIEPMTQEVLDEIRTKELVNRLDAIRWKDLPLNVLERVAAALD